jgi:hypothetical protein
MVHLPIGFEEYMMFYQDFCQEGIQDSILKLE